MGTSPAAHFTRREAARKRAPRAPRRAAHPTQAAKSQVGLDQHQVRRWDSWHRFTTLALAAPRRADNQRR